jgi:hypothetical protein
MMPRRLPKFDNETGEPLGDDPRYGMHHRVIPKVTLARLDWMSRRPSAFWDMSERDFRRELAKRG